MCKCPLVCKTFIVQCQHKSQFCVSQKLTPNANISGLLLEAGHPPHGEPLICSDWFSLGMEITWCPLILTAGICNLIWISLSVIADPSLLVLLAMCKLQSYGKFRFFLTVRVEALLGTGLPSHSNLPERWWPNSKCWSHGEATEGAGVESPWISTRFLPRNLNNSS